MHASPRLQAKLTMFPRTFFDNFTAMIARMLEKSAVCTMLSTVLLLLFDDSEVGGKMIICEHLHIQLSHCPTMFMFNISSL